MTPDPNPLLADAGPIPFDRIRAEHVEPGIRQALAEARAVVDTIAAGDAPPRWDTTLGPLDEAAERLARRIAPASHLVAVAQTPELREAYNAVLPDISAFWSGLHLDERLWSRIEAYSTTEEAQSLTGIRRRHLDKTLREFRRAGADLPEAQKERLRALHVEMASLEQKFSENVLDATAAYELLVTDEQRLSGVPEPAKKRAAAKAREAGKEGWLLTLDYPSVEPILKHCEDRALRREIHAAYCLRCRDGEWDNRPLIARLLRLRDELATLLGYATFADYQLEDRMARDGTRAQAFEADLVTRTRPYWARDTRALEAHAATLGLDVLQPWDVAFVAEKLRKAHFDLDDELLRPWFALDRVERGLFDIVERVFGFRVVEIDNDRVWHADVRTFALYEGDIRLGVFYTDWFPRKEKRPGAWMDAFATGGPDGDGFTPHVGAICGNFTPPQDGTPALLTHDEVQTLFHEFGHLLHHCTSRVAVPARAGIHVAWDFVELPSQIMENWTWERDALDLFARHHETGEPLPEEIFQRMLDARRFLGGWYQMRQLSFGTLDLLLHADVAPRLRREAATDGEDVDARQGQEVVDLVRDLLVDFSPTAAFADLHVLTSFSHLFAGGYAAGYYSYLWSEVLDADAFTRFRDAGVLDGETGRAYVRAILSQGDSEDPEVLFRAFMGRDPDAGALLERNLGPLEAEAA